MREPSWKEKFKKAEELGSKEKAKVRVTGFVRRRKYDILTKQGLAPEEAARRLGVKIPHGITLKPDELLRKIERGG
jgi:hypothetical protein